MSRRPRASWARSGWELESSHVPGSYRMLGIWAASFASIPVVVVVGAPRLGLHVAMVVALGVAVVGLVVGAAVYLQVSRPAWRPIGAEQWAQIEDAQRADTLTEVAS